MVSHISAFIYFYILFVIAQGLLFKYNYLVSYLLSQLFLSVLGLHCSTGFLQLQRAGASLSLWCTGFSSWWLPLLQSTGSRASRLRWLWHRCSVVSAPGLQSTGSIVAVNGLSCSQACGIFLDQRPNPCLLHQQADSLPLSH